MDITQTTASTAAASTSSNAEARTSLTSDYEMFLKMLTTQMTNQDPLNPVDSSDYAVQLATFSSVEQQVLTNELLLDLSGQLGATGLSDLAGYVGREVRSEAPAYFEGEPIEIVPQLLASANAARLTVRNEAGDVVQEFDLDASGSGVVWAGTNASGDTLPAGLYSFEVTSLSDGKELGTTNGQTYGQILEAQTTPTGIQLILRGGVVIKPSDVTAMRQ